MGKNLKIRNELDRFESELYHAFNDFLQMDGKGSTKTPSFITAKLMRTRVEHIIKLAEREHENTIS